MQTRLPSVCIYLIVAAPRRFDPHVNMSLEFIDFRGIDMRSEARSLPPILAKMAEFMFAITVLILFQG